MIPSDTWTPGIRGPRRRDSRESQWGAGGTGAAASVTLRNSGHGRSLHYGRVPGHPRMSVIVGMTGKRVLTDDCEGGKAVSQDEVGGDGNGGWQALGMVAIHGVT